MDPTKRIIAEACRLLRCDTARIIGYGRKRFLVIGHNRSTKQDAGQWVDQDGNVRDWDYVQEATIASGNSWTELRRSLRRYHAVSQISWSGDAAKFIKQLEFITGHGRRIPA